MSCKVQLCIYAAALTTYLLRSYLIENIVPVLYRTFPETSYFAHGRIYASVLLSQFIPPFPSPAACTSPFSMSTQCSVMTSRGGMGVGREA